MAKSSSKHLLRTRWSSPFPLLWQDSNASLIKSPFSPPILPRRRQPSSAPLPETKKTWFRTTEFRKAISMAINRADLSRIVFGGHAHPAFGPVSPANHFWFNSSLPIPQYDSAGALRLLAQAGFRLQGGTLRDSSGNRVEFTVITNSGNKSREEMVAMIQQDLSQIGIKENLVTLDFPSLIEP